MSAVTMIIAGPFDQNGRPCWQQREVYCPNDQFVYELHYEENEQATLYYIYAVQGSV
jgi:hypothetical protein